MDLEKYEPFLYMYQNSYNSSYIKENLESFEKEVSYKFPEDFKKIIYKYDGASFMVNGFSCANHSMNEFFGFLSFCKENKYNIWNTLLKKWNDTDFNSKYVAFSYDKNFDVICYSRKDNSIWLFDKDDKTYSFLANNIIDFINAFYNPIEVYEFEDMEAKKYFKYHQVNDQLAKYIGVKKNKYNRSDFEKLLTNKYKAIKLKEISELNRYVIPYIEYGEPDFDKKSISDLTNEEIESLNYDIYFINNKEVIDNYYVSKRSGYKILFDYVIIEHDYNDDIINFYSFRNASHLNAEIDYFIEKKSDKAVIKVDKNKRLK